MDGKALADELERLCASGDNGFIHRIAVLVQVNLPTILSTLRAGQWRPIETAPKSESEPFFVLRPLIEGAPVVIQVSRFEGRLYPDARDACIDWEDGITDATHWLPRTTLPTPPTEKG